MTVRRLLAVAVAVAAILACVPATAQPGGAGQAATGTSSPQWQFGAFLDLGSLNSFNSPSNHLFRSRGTTPRVDELNLNMAGAYVRKKASDSSRWGVELTGHGGEDSQVFGFSATAPNVGAAGWLRRLGPTNISYLAPVGSGLTVQGGIFSSFIGYDSLYAKDNFTYTRPWTADFTPYLMLGVNAVYPVSDKYWRFLSNTIVERKADRLTAAFDFHVSSEGVDVAGNPRAWWVAGQLPVHWIIHGPWSATVRPEFAWDSAGRWTTFEQAVKAISSTLEYRAAFHRSRAIVRLEHRYDHSTGKEGGFFKGREVSPGIVPLTPGQPLLILGLIVTVDAPR